MESCSTGSCLIEKPVKMNFSVIILMAASVETRAVSACLKHSGVVSCNTRVRIGFFCSRAWTHIRVKELTKHSMGTL